MSLAMALVLAGLGYYVGWRRRVRARATCVQVGLSHAEREAENARARRESIVVGLFLGVPALLAVLWAIADAFSSN